MKCPQAKPESAAPALTISASSTCFGGGLAVRKLPVTQVPLLAEPLVLLHGWGADSHIWEPVISGLNRIADLWLLDLPGFGESPACFNSDNQACDPHADDPLDDVLSQVLNIAPPQAVYLGWSLGGMLATALAARCPHRVTGLITLASNISFIARKNWPRAMPAQTFNGFYQGFCEAPLLTLKRFCGLQAQGDGNERQVLKWLRHRLPGASLTEVIADTWRPTLGLLAAIDNGAAYNGLTTPGLHLLGEKDVLVPATAGRELAARNPQQRVEVLPNTGHALHVSQPQKVVDLVVEFLRKKKYHLDKRKVAQSFSRAAPSYDSVAGLQRDVGARLLQLLSVQEGVRFKEPEPAHNSDGIVILDLGSGTGYFSEKLRRDYPGAEIIGLDIATGMLQFARRQRQASVHWLCGDAESLPLADQCVDIVFSSLTVQWCEHPAPLIKELKRVLKPGGRLAFSTLGPATLKELRRAWEVVDNFTHVNRFIAAAELQAALDCNAFQALHWGEENRLLHYRELRQLTHELKSLGAHNVNTGRSAGLTGRRRLQALRSAYEQFRQCRGLPATYEVYYFISQAGGADL